jgi:histidine triad (HIT) family protein
MPSLFTRIIEDEIPAWKVAENDEFLAFLDISPLAKGHTLVIPKKEVDYIFDIDDDLYAHFFLFAKKVARAIEKVIECERIGIAVVGLEVPHAHIHLVPLNKVSDIDFSRPKLKISNEEMENISTKIRKSFEEGQTS